MIRTLNTKEANVLIQDNHIAIAKTGSNSIICSCPLSTLATIRYADVASPWEARCWSTLSAEGVEVDVREDGFALLLHGFGGKRITLELLITVQDDAFVFLPHVKNGESGIVVGVELPIFTGFQEQETSTLYLPNRPGQLLPRPFQAFPTLQEFVYPVPLSFQLITVNTDSEGWFLACHDQSMSYKQFCFGGEQRQASVVQYPFLASSQEASLAPVVFALYTGTWHVASDHYRTWFERWAKQPELSPLLRQLPITTHITVRARPVEDAILHDITKDQETWTYERARQQAQQLHEQGWEAIHTVGWHGRGHDTDYPTYAVSEDMGGRQGLQAYAQQVKELGMHLGYYMNGRLINTSEQHTPQLKKCVIIPSLVPLEQKYSHELYGNEHFVVACPCAEGFIAAQVERVIELVEDFSADFVQLDQIGAADCLLCFDQRHGHATPATAWAEGYQRMLTRVQEAGRVRHPGFWCWIEGSWEGAGQYVDLTQGGFWPVHPTARRYDELYHYTFPTHPIMNNAFLGGIPFWQGGRKNPAVTYVKRYRDFYNESRFMDRLGLTFDEAHVSAKWHLSPNTLVLIARNNTPDQLTTTLTLCWPELPSHQQLERYELLSTGEPQNLQLQEGQLTVTLTLFPASYDGCYLQWSH